MRRRKHSPGRPPRPSRAAQERTVAADSGLWLYGQHAVKAALANPQRTVKRWLVTQPSELSLRPSVGRPPAEVVERHALERLLPPGAAHQGIAALVAPLPALDLEQALGRGLISGVRRVVLLDQVSDPRNVGAILRTCAAFAVDALVLTHRHAPPESGALAKAASGALESVPLVRVANLAQALEALARLNFWRIGLDAEAASDLAESDLSGDLALVLGAEGRGLRRLTAARCDVLARLPTASTMASLNVSAAAAIALFLAYRAA